MNRTDRLYAIVEELRAHAPRPLSARRLAEHFEVSLRTVERDLLALAEAGVPIWAEQGRKGGYSLDPRTTLPPLNLTAEEATALSIALASAGDIPFAKAARAAGRKLAAVMSADGRRSAGALSERVRIAAAESRSVDPDVRNAVEEAVTRRAVLALDYVDADGEQTHRDVEAHGLFGGPAGWYLIGWCRVRDDGRIFRLDRIRAAAETGETAPERAVDEVLGYVPMPVGRPDLIE